MGKGRPKGVKNGEGTHVLAPIKNWKPWMTKIVIMHMAGMAAKEIAEQFPSKKNPGKFLSTTRVSQIICDQQGQQMIQGMNAKVKEDMMKDIETGLVVLTEKSVKKLHDTLNAEAEIGSRFKIHQDNIALQLVKTHVGRNEDANGKGNGDSLSDKNADRIVAALEKSARAKALHGHIVDAEFSVEEKSA